MTSMGIVRRIDNVYTLMTKHGADKWFPPDAMEAPFPQSLPEVTIEEVRDPEEEGADGQTQEPEYRPKHSYQAARLPKETSDQLDLLAARMTTLEGSISTMRRQNDRMLALISWMSMAMPTQGAAPPRPPSPLAPHDPPPVSPSNDDAALADHTQSTSTSHDPPLADH